jgi:hypothetical protein
MAKNILRLILALLSLFFVLIPITSCGGSHASPYQGSLTGNWSGDLTVVGRSIPIGGTMSLTIDKGGVASGSLASTRGVANAATISGQVGSDGNLIGTVSFTLEKTTFISNWQGKITASGKTLGMQGTWTSQHGSGTFSGTGSK